MLFIARNFMDSYVKLTCGNKIIPISYVLVLELTELRIESVIFWRESKYLKLLNHRVFD